MRAHIEFAQQISTSQIDLAGKYKRNKLQTLYEFYGAVQRCCNQATEHKPSKGIFVTLTKSTRQISTFQVDLEKRYEWNELKNKQESVKNTNFLDLSGGVMGLKSQNRQNAYLRLLLNLHAKFQPPWLDLEGIYW